MAQTSKTQPDWLSEASIRIISHMNDDHADCIQASLKAQHDISDPYATMHKLAVDGYYICSNNKLYFIAFNAPCNNSQEYKQALVEQANQYLKS